MDDDEEQVTGFARGAGVVITCDVPEGTEKYIGYVIGMDDLYLYARVTHTWGERVAEVTEESVSVLKGMLMQRPVWLLRVQVLSKGIMPLWLNKEQLVEVLSDVMQGEAVRQAGPQGGFIAEVLPTEMSLPHFSVRNIKSLADVMAGSVLTSLDFAPELTYTEESDVEEGDHGDKGTEGPASGD
jgi:hypothetical protein